MDSNCSYIITNEWVYSVVVWHLLHEISRADMPIAARLSKGKCLIMKTLFEIGCVEFWLCVFNWNVTGVVIMCNDPWN